jgi:predicted nucleic acid-binding protein
VLVYLTIFTRSHPSATVRAGFGRAVLAYRKRGGIKRSPMPDFYVGAHAVIGSMTLLTRDAARYRTYFPELNIIAPK